MRQEVRINDTLEYISAVRGVASSLASELASAAEDLAQLVRGLEAIARLTGDIAQAEARRARKPRVRPLLEALEVAEKYIPPADRYEEDRALVRAAIAKERGE